MRHLTRDEIQIARQLDTVPMHLAKILTGLLALAFLVQIQMEEGDTWGYLQILTTWFLVVFVMSTIKQGIFGLLRVFSKS